MRWALIVAVVTAVPVVARADAAPIDLAKAHFRLGSDKYAAGAYRDAVHEFLEAYRLSKRPELLYNIGLCYEKLDDPGRSTQHYTRYLAQKPDAPERTEIEAQLYRMSSRVAKLQVRTSEIGAEVWLDGEMVGLAPLEPVALTEGRHRVETRQGGASIASAEVELRGGLSTSVDLEPGSTVAPVPGPGRGPAPVPDAPKRRWLWPVVGVAAAVVVAVVVVGVLLGVRAGDLQARERDGCTPERGCATVDFAMVFR